jgi:hypothetical protein
MTAEIAGLSNAEAWRLLVTAARMAAEASGYATKRLPGRGLSNVWWIEKEGIARRAAIRTTRDRWIAFPPLGGGTRWKTLDDVDVVIVAAVDAPARPEHVEVFVLSATEVRARFADAYAVRSKAGLKIRDNFGMWIKLDLDNRDTPASAGSGLADVHEPLVVFSLADLLKLRRTVAAVESPPAGPGPADAAVGPNQVTAILAEAREKVARSLGVKPESVKLDLKVEY